MKLDFFDESGFDELVFYPPTSLLRRTSPSLFQSHVERFRHGHFGH